MGNQIGFYTGPLMTAAGEGLHTTVFEAFAVARDAGTPESIWVVLVNEPVLMLGMRDYFRAVPPSTVSHLGGVLLEAVSLMPRTRAAWFSVHDEEGV